MQLGKAHAAESGGFTEIDGGDAAVSTLNKK